MRWQMNTPQVVKPQSVLVRDREDAVRQAALAAAGVQKYIDGKQVVKVIVAP